MMGRRSITQLPHIDSLPIEVLFQVFSNLAPAYLCETVSKVCRYWEDLCKDPCLYKTLEFRGGEVSVETAIKLLKQAPLLKALTLVNMKCMDNILEEVSQHNLKIRSLVLEKKTKHSIKQMTMTKITKNCTELQTLILRKCYVRGKEWNKNVFAMKLPHLKTLHLNNVCDSDPEAVSQVANSCFDLEEIAIFNNLPPTGGGIIIFEVISNECIIALCNRFQKSLRSFRLGENGKWSREASCGLLKCDRLENLSIVWPRDMTNEDLQTISSITNLRRLELALFVSRVHPIYELNIVRMFTSGGLTNLVSLKLCCDKLTDEVGVAIGDHLQNLQILSLHELKITIGSLTMIGVRYIIKGCLRLRQLALDLDYFDTRYTTDEVVLLIQKYLPGLKKLKFISSYEYDYFEDVETRVPDAQIKERMPDVQIELGECLCIYGLCMEM